jgi:hypothetical protein
MHLVELERSLRQLRLGGMAAVLETRLRQAAAEPMAPIDLIACLVSDEPRAGPIGCSSAAANRRVSGTRIRLSITSTSPSIQNEPQPGV